MSEIIHGRIEVPLNRLTASNTPLRGGVANDDAHAELVASIRAHGLLEPLIVAAADQEGAYSVVGGNRRLAALAELCGAGVLAEDAPIGCTVIPPDADAGEIALAENTIRVAMHPADQAVAFLALHHRGAGPEQIANRFGTTSAVVTRRLRLAALAPPIMAAYRSGKMSERIAHAFATTSEHERQMRVFNEIVDEDGDFDDSELDYYGTRPLIESLHQDRARTDCAAARFVGLDAYRAAGGGIEEALFEEFSVVTDVGLLERLAKEKLDAEAAGITGWKWVKPVFGDAWHTIHALRRLTPTQPDPTEAEAAAIAACDELERRWNDIDYDDEEAVAALRTEGAPLREAKRQALQAMHGRSYWTDEQKAAAGVVLSIDRNGEPTCHEGLVKEGDPVPGEKVPLREDPSVVGSVGQPVPQEKPKKAREKHPEAVKDAITMLRTAVMRRVLAEKPEMAMDVLIFSLLMQIETGRNGFYPGAVLQIRGEYAPAKRADGATDLMRQYTENVEPDLSWLNRKQTAAESFADFLALPDEKRWELGAAALAHLLVPRRIEGGLDVLAVAAREMGIDFAGELTACDPGVWNAEMYWSRLRKDVIIDECRPWLGAEWAAGARKLKKGDLAADAAEKMQAHPNYLPDGFVYRAAPAGADGGAPGDQDGAHR